MSTNNQEGMRSSQISGTWRPDYDLKDANIEQKIKDPPASHLGLQAMLQRGVTGFGEMSLTVEVQGIYALPDEWVSKIDDPAEAAFTYEVRALGANLKGGKIVAKQDPEEAKEGADAASLKGKQPPPKKGAKDVTPEEDHTQDEETKKKEKEERDRMNAELQDQWNKLTPE